MYVKGSERKFRGMRGFDPGRQLLVRRGPRSPFAGVPAPIDLAQLYAEGKLGEVFEDAAAQVDTKNLPGVLKQADAAAKKYLGVGADAAKQQAFKFLYLQSRSVLTRVFQTGWVKNTAEVLAAGQEITANIRGIVDALPKKGEKIDASGVVNIASLSHKIVGTLTSLGRSAGFIDSKIQNEIMEWSNVAVGCAAATSLGPVMGAAACTLQVLGKLIPAVGRVDSMPPAGTPRAIFVPTQGQLVLAAADAARLAALLRYKYGLASYSTIYKNLTTPDLGTTYDHPDEGVVDETAFFSDKSYPAINATNAIARPAIDLRVALACMRFAGKDSPGLENTQGFAGTPWGATRDALSKLADSGQGGLIGDTSTSRAYSSRFIYDHDVPVQAIDAGYNWWVWANPTAARPARGLDAFKRVHELINFFAALSAAEMRRNNFLALGYVPGGGVTLPVRLYAVNDIQGDGCRHDIYDTENCSRFGEQCWTSGERCGIGTNRCALDFRPLVQKGDLCALRQLGAIRLMAAFSYMHMVYMRSTEPYTGIPLPNRDMIATLPVSTDPAITVELPVDIFTVGGTTAMVNGAATAVKDGWPSKEVPEILTAIEAKIGVVNALAAQAEAAAKADAATLPDTNLSPELVAAFQAATQTAAGTSSQEFQQMVSAKWGSQITMATPAASSGSGSGGAVLLAGAALAALLLLKR